MAPFDPAAQRLSDHDYQIELKKLFEAIRDADGLDRAATLVEQRLALVFDRRFLGEMLRYLQASPLERMTLLMLDLPISQALENLPPDQLGPQGIALALFFTADDPSDFFMAFAPYLDIQFYVALEEIATATEQRPDLDPDEGHSLISGWRRRGRRMLLLWVELLLSEPLQLVLDVPVAQFLAHIIHQAQGSLGSRLLQLRSIHEYLRNGDGQETLPAYCAWVIEHAVNLANELPAAQPPLLADMLLFDSVIELRGWLRAAEGTRRTESQAACMDLLRWLTELAAAAPPPIRAFQRLTQASDKAQVRQLVYAEPAILIEQRLIGGYDKSGIFVNSWFPIATADPQRVLMVVQELDRLRRELGSAEHNPVIAAAQAVNSGALTLDEAARRLRASGPLDAMLLIGADYAAAETIGDDYSLSRVLAALNWRLAAAVSDHPTLLATLANSYTASFLNDRESADAVPLAQQSVELVRPLGHAVLLPVALYNLGRSLDAVGDLEGAAAAYTEGFNVALAIPPAYGRDDFLFALADLAATAAGAAANKSPYLDQMAYYLDLIEHYGVSNEESTSAARYWAMRGRYFWARGEGVEAAQAWAQAAAITSRLDELMMLPELIADATRAQRGTEALSLLDELLRAVAPEGATIKAAMLAMRKLALLLDLARPDQELHAAYQQFQALVAASGADRSARLGPLVQQVKLGYLRRFGSQDQVDEVYAGLLAQRGAIAPGDWAMGLLSYAEDLSSRGDFATALAALEQVQALADSLPVRMLAWVRHTYAAVAARQGDVLAGAGRAAEAAAARHTAAANWRQVSADSHLEPGSRIVALDNLCLLYRRTADLDGLSWAIHALAALYDEAASAE